MSAVEATLALTRGAFSLDVSLSLGIGCTGVVGASGSGKTTLLRCLAGLERASGQLRVAGEVWQDERSFLPAHERRVGYVFQEQALFPHLRVRDNLLFGFRRIPPAQRKISLEEVVSLLGLDALLTRTTHGLSGGERQRVAIGRALLTSPALLLMDEPLASLDLRSRAHILPYLERVHAALDVPLLYVTHAPSELTRLADHVLYLEAGRVRAAGALNDVLTRADLPLSQADDAGAVLQAQVLQQLDAFHLLMLQVAGGTLAVAKRDYAVGTTMKVHVRARDVSICLDRPQRTSINNVLDARVLSVHGDAEPAYRLVRLDLGQGATLLARITALSVQQLLLEPGKHVFAQVKAASLVE